MAFWFRKLGIPFEGIISLDQDDEAEWWAYYYEPQERNENDETEDREEDE